MCSLGQSSGLNGRDDWGLRNCGESGQPGLAGHGEDFGVYFEWSGKPQEGLEQMK